MKKELVKSPFREIVQLPLLETDFEHLVALATEKTELYGYIGQIVGDGYEVTLSKNQTGRGYTCRIGGVYSEINSGYYLYANGDTPEYALAGAMYKHFFLAKGGDWKSVASQPSNRPFS